MSSPQHHRYDCILVGAGIAGLAAARTLAEAGRSVLLLEARDRVGGRLLTVHAPGEATPIELGAEFIHGRPPELLALLNEAGLACYETAGDNLSYAHGRLQALDSEDQGAFTLLDELEESGDDLSFDEFLARRQPPAPVAARARRYVEGFNAADASLIGTRGLARQQAAEDAIHGDRSARLVGGYLGLAEYLRSRAVTAGATLLLNTPVAALDWQPGAVHLTTAAGEQYRGRAAVLTLPLGVLQARSVRFSPLPHATFAAADLLACGTVHRLVLCFRTRFWADRTADLATEMRFLFTEDEMPPTWWTTAPHASPLLTGWVGGPRALTVLTAADLLSSALRSLERIFSLEPASLALQLLSWHVHDWQRDPWSLGAYSYARKGGYHAAQQLAAPVQGTLFFAGEHTDITGHPGTVHGALRSGLRAAAQVLDSL